MATGFDYLASTSTSLPVRAIESTRSALFPYSSNLTRLIMTSPQSPSNSPTAESPALQHIRLAITVMHLFLVSIGSVNLLVVFVIASRRYMRSITNVYIVSLCMADFIYLANLILVAATQLNNKSWPFGQLLCTLYHGTESTGKYASVMFVVLLAADRYCAMCRPNFCARYRNYKVALGLSVMAWAFALTAAFPLFAYSEDIKEMRRGQTLCIIKWPSSESARWYITVSSVLIFAIPLSLIVFFYYNILRKLKEALKGNKRMRRTSSSRAPYHRVTRLVLWVVIFHVICWSPFWVFNLFSSIFRIRVSTQLDRIIVNVIHLFPYLNCALNPLVYAINAENFRRAFRSMFCITKRNGLAADSRFTTNGLSTRSVLVTGINASSERLLGVNYAAKGPLSIGQRCSNSALLNGSILLPHIPSGSTSETSTKRNSSSLGIEELDGEYRKSSGTVVRFATIDSQSDNDADDDMTTNSLSERPVNRQIRIQPIISVEEFKTPIEAGEDTSLSDSTTSSSSIKSYPVQCDVGDQSESDIFM